MRSIFRTYKAFLTEGEVNFLLIYISLFAIFSIGIVPKDVILVLLTVVFLLASTRCALLMFLFFTLWEQVTVFSFGITLNMVFQVLLFSKLLVNSFIRNKALFHSILDIQYLLLMFFYGTMNFLIGKGTLSGIGMGFNAFIAIAFSNIYRDKKQASKLWEAVFLTLMLSTILAVLYGFLNQTSLDRWISGMGYVSQIYGTVGTARIGMYLCVSLIYPVFYLRNPILKLALCLGLSFAVVMTLSITAMVCLGVFWVMVILFKDIKKFKQNFKKTVLVVLCMMVITFFWADIQEITYIKPIIVRVNTLMDAFSIGDMTVATSSRSSLAEAYLKDFREYSTINKIFGSFYVNRVSVVTNHSDITHYAHNSFVDILLYFGIIGTVLFLARILSNVLLLRKTDDFLQIFILKIIFVITGFSVSMSASSYWLVWLIL